MPDQWIMDAGKIIFHTVGDTGGVNDGAAQQTLVAHSMQAQVEAAPASDKPAFFYNLGDVVYFNGQSSDYSWQFYEPYQYYQPYIFAIAGNHDGDIRTRRNDPPVTEPTLTGFMNNFCDDSPREIQPYHRDTMTQPYVYWTLDAPFVTIIGLYSNIDGTLDGRGGFEQKRWLREQLLAAKGQDKCLVVAVHHPPFSLDRPHGGSPDILSALDRAIADTGKAPDAVFSGHVHSYQRFTRRANGRALPFVVAGAGGYAHIPKAMHKLQTNPDDGGPIQTPFQTTVEGVTLEAYNDTEPGFLRVTVDDKTLTSEYFLVPFEGAPPADPVDSFTLNWKTHKLV
jgi:3',5'-cyclic AMP phosphodiesterase CpdA